MQRKTDFRAGLYLRLSKDDERQGESVSIETQRAILIDYCLEHGFTVYKEYVDDGYSGLNFNRPGFQQLLEDVEAGEINMVITKDLSRLPRSNQGRDPNRSSNTFYVMTNGRMKAELY